MTEINMRKKVLIALDYDPSAQDVAEAGFSLARTMSAEVILLHVISEFENPEFSPVNNSPRMEQFQANSAEGLKRASEDFLDNSKDHLGDDSIQTLVKFGDFAQSIIEAAKDFYADIIVIGSHSRKWAGKTDMGSVTVGVLHNSSVPLFIIPTRKIQIPNRKYAYED